MRGAWIFLAALLATAPACGAAEQASGTKEAAPTNEESGSREGSRKDRPADDPLGHENASAATSAPLAPYPQPDPALHARLHQQLHGVLGDEYAKRDWNALMQTRVPWNGIKVWVPGTGSRTYDVAEKRAMASVPKDFGLRGPSISFTGNTAIIGVWFGIPCSQSEAGAVFADKGMLSALDVFETAWSDALAIVAALGPKIKGAWLVGHSAGANPVVLAGLIGGAARVDAYGVPSAVGPLDGDDGLVHLHTDPLDPAGSMGKLSGTDAQIDLLSAFATTLKAGSVAKHDYESWPATSPE